MQNHRFIGLITTIQILLFAPSLFAATLFDYPVININTNEAVSLSLDTRPVVVLFFEPDCSWCFKQSKVYSRLAKRCQSEVQFIGLGVNGSRQAIKKEAWHLQAAFPLYMASRPMLDAIGSVDSTPLSVLLNSQQQIAGKARGYLNQDKWQALYQRLIGPSQCFEDS